MDLPPFQPIAAACSPTTSVDTSTAGPGEEDLAPRAIPARRAVLAAFGPMTVGGWGTRPNATEHDDLDEHGRKACPTPWTS